MRDVVWNGFFDELEKVGEGLLDRPVVELVNKAVSGHYGGGGKVLPGGAHGRAARSGEEAVPARNVSVSDTGTVMIRSGRSAPAKHIPSPRFMDRNRTPPLRAIANRVVGPSR